MEKIKDFFKNLILSIILLAVIACMVLLGFGYVNYRQTIEKLPIAERIAQITSKPDYVTYEEISPYLINATIAIEDRTFFEHGGINYLSIIRSLLSNVLSGSVISGGSTITQQLVKNLYFDFDTSILRKTSEIFFAYDIENSYEKEEILALYLNVINYGDNHMGISEAADGYFGKTPKELGLSEASLLAGIPQSPSNLQLSNHFTEAKERQKKVLKDMITCEMLSQEEMDYVRDLYEIAEDEN